jgi:hypothetical protein
LTPVRKWSPVMLTLVAGACVDTVERKLPPLTLTPARKWSPAVTLTPAKKQSPVTLTPSRKMAAGEVDTGEKMVAGSDIDTGAILTFVLLERGSWREWQLT